MCDITSFAKSKHMTLHCIMLFLQLPSTAEMHQKFHHPFQTIVLQILGELLLGVFHCWNDDERIVDEIRYMTPTAFELNSTVSTSILSIKTSCSAIEINE